MVFGLHRHKETESDTTQQILTQTYLATRHPPTSAETENRREKGIDIDMIDAEEIIAELQALAHFKFRIPKLESDATQSKIECEERDGVRPWAIAALGYLNKVWPTIWMSTFNADTTKLRVRTAFHEIRKSMPPEDKQRFGVVLNMVRDLCIARCEDMKEGHKPLLLKVRREDISVRMPKSDQKGALK